MWARLGDPSAGVGLEQWGKSDSNPGFRRWDPQVQGLRQWGSCEDLALLVCLVVFTVLSTEQNLQLTVKRVFVPLR